VGEQDYKTETIANADDIADADGVAILSFAQAQAVAREMRARGARIAAGLPVEMGPYTVKQCMAEYLTWMEQNRKGARDARYRAEALIIPKLGAAECEKLRADELRAWLQGVAKASARVRAKKGSGPRFREVDEQDEDTVRRRRASANRTLTILKAALNMAWREGKIASDDAWRRVTPFEEADAARVRYLQIDEAQRLINASDTEFRALVRAALATGARYSELANLRVADFNPDAGTVHVRASKSGKGRHIVLTEEGIRQFDDLCAGRTGTEWILLKGGASKWLKSHQTRPMREACVRGGIAPLASFHTLRHTYASLSIMAAAPLLVVATNLGHSDTRMVEKHYGHLAADYVAREIRKAAPRFEPNQEMTIVPFRGGR
jgi:integrase